MKPERIAEIEDTLRSPGFGLAGIERHELLHLLRCARAWAELGELLRSDAVKSGLATALFVNAPDAPLSNRYAVTTGRSHMSKYEPDLLTATEAALAKAKETT